jgi:hypothetical protein
LVSSKNLKSLEDAINKVEDIGRTPTLDKKFYIDQPCQVANLASLTYA